MDNSANDNAKVTERSAEWHQEAAYHLYRAAQEEWLAARSEGPEAELAHSILARGHLARAAAAEAVAHMPDAEGVRGSRAPTKS